ncbi:MAG: pantetheine-phosphate adenylyltransferase [Flavobacteriales bacterium]|jgi:pantetheine-phosphate adenylyltransferase
MNKRIAVFPGSFDPITKGHEAVILKALPLFDEIILAIGVNTTKSYLFSLEQRKSWLQETFKNQSKIQVHTYEGLTVDFCKKNKADFILRGLRNTNDFVFEQNIAQMNQDLRPEIETICLFTNKIYSAINASIVRELIKNKAKVEQFVPDAITITY